MDVGKLAPASDQYVISQLIQTAQEYGQQLLEAQEAESAARRHSTDALNQTTRAWNAVYDALLELKKSKSPGLKDSKLGELLEKAPFRP